MGELYEPYPKLPKNIRQIGERDDIVRVYVEDYVNTYLKRLFPTGGQDLRAGVLLGSTEEHGGLTYVFIDGALEMEGVTEEGEKVVFSEEVWKKAYQQMEDMFPKRTVQGWFLCGVPGCLLSPLNYWKQHSQYFSGKHKLMYLNSGLEGEEAYYITSSDGFYKLRGHCIYYERNQMMQDYMVSRKDVQRVEAGGSDPVIRDFRKRMEKKKEIAASQDHTISFLRGMCACLAILALAGGVAAVNSVEKMKDMETVMASALPAVSEAAKDHLLRAGIGLPDLSGTDGADMPANATDTSRPTDPSGVVLEEVSGGIFPSVPAGADDPSGEGQEQLSGSEGSQLALGGDGTALAMGESNAAPAAGGANGQAGSADQAGGADQADGKVQPDPSSGQAVGQASEEDAHGQAAGEVSGEGAHGQAAGETSGEGASGQAAKGAPEKGGEQAQKTEDAVAINAAGERVKSDKTSPKAEDGQDSPSGSGQTGTGQDEPAGEEGAEATEAFAARQLEPAPGQGVYVVQPGETLYGICFKLYQNLSKIDEICQINGIEDIDMLEAGRRLIVP